MEPSSSWSHVLLHHVQMALDPAEYKKGESAKSLTMLTKLMNR